MGIFGGVVVVDGTVLTWGSGIGTVVAAGVTTSAGGCGGGGGSGLEFDEFGD